MKTAKNTFLVLIGLLVGAGITYLAMPDQDSDKWVLPEPVSQRVSPDSSDDPFGGDPSGLQPQEYRKMNMSKLSDRDILISLWYLDQGTVVDRLQSRTGYKFTPVGKLHASPIEILEEQLTFMKKFLTESDRMESERDE